MEENIIVEAAAQERGMKIGAEEKALLLNSGKWAKIIAIIYFVCLGLYMLGIVVWMLAAGVVGMSMYDINPAMGAMSGVYGAIMWPMVILFIAIYAAQFYVALYLYRFSQKAKVAVTSNDQTAMTESFFNLHSYFKIYGILLIAALSFAVLCVIGAIVVAAIL